MRPEEEDSTDPQKLTGMALICIGAMALLFIVISVVMISLEIYSNITRIYVQDSKISQTKVRTRSDPG